MSDNSLVTTWGRDRDDDFQRLLAAKERKRAQNRVAQRTYREKVKRQVRCLEEWRDSWSSPPTPRQRQPPQSQHRAGGSEIGIEPSEPQPPRGTSHQLQSAAFIPLPDGQKVQANKSEASRPLLQQSVERDKEPLAELGQAQSSHAESRETHRVPQWTDSAETRMESLATIPLFEIGEDIDGISWGLQLPPGDLENFEISNLSAGPGLYTPKTLHDLSSSAKMPPELTVSVDESSYCSNSPVSGSTDSVTSSCNRQVREGKTALHLVAENGWHKSLRIILQRTGDARCRDGKGQTALHLAAKNNHIEVIRELLHMHKQDKVLLDINARDHRGMTALHVAATNGAEAVMEVLLEDRGTDLYARIY